MICKLAPIVAIIVFSFTAQAQSLVCMAPEEADGKAESVTVLVRTENAAIKMIRVISEKSGKTSTEKIVTKKTHSLNLKLETGDNVFNILGYSAVDKLLSGETCTVLVKKQETPQNDASVDSGSSLSNSNIASQLTEIGNTVKKIQEDVKKPKDEQGEIVTGSKNFRAVVGFEQVGASSSPSKQQPFFDFYFSTPLFDFKKDSKEATENDSKKATKSKNSAKRGIFDPELSLWGNARFAALPGQDLSSLAGFTPAGFAANFVQADASSKLGNFVQSFEFQAGFELQLFKSKTKVAGFFPGRSSVSLILSAGAATPLSFEQGASFYKIPKENGGAVVDSRFSDLFPGVTTQKTVAFLSPERERFLRQYNFGFRFKTHYYKTQDGEKSWDEMPEREDIVPGMFDVTFGQNEAITKKMRGVILRLDGSLPIPIFNNTLYLFGSANMKLGKSTERPIPGIFLAPETTGDLSSADVLVVSAEKNPFLRTNRDTFRFGVGIDLLRLFKKEKSKE